MAQLFNVPVTLCILGPFLTAATGPASYGLDKTFHRDYQGDLVIPASHIKGKLRMALEELALFFEVAARPDLKGWFGVRSEEVRGDEDVQDEYTPATGRLRFSDLHCTTLGQAATRTRVVVNPQTRTAAENLLREIEDPFASGAETRWTGSITFYAENADAANTLAKTLQIGLRWLPNLGAEKGVGYGRLRQVCVGKPTPEAAVPLEIQRAPENPALTLRIHALEPIHIGGVKSRRTNFARSRRIIPGTLIKGALAEALNQAHGVRPIHRVIAKDYADDYPDFALLAEHFHAIRVTMALPAHVGDPRPLTIPISTVEHLDELRDTALCPDLVPFVAPQVSGEKAQAPLYFIDWKSGARYFGAVDPKEIFVTRGEIDDVSQRSREGQLFTYSFICPEDEEGGLPIEWVCSVDFPSIEDAEVLGNLRAQFSQAVQLHLRYLGKLRRAVQIGVHSGHPTHVKPCLAPIVDGLSVITLQSNTIMLDPAKVRALQPYEDLQSLYAKYWSTLSGGSLELEDFFAHQGFEGGYLYHRFLGAAERKAHPNNYRPYYLTQAGSVFRLRVKDEGVAQTKLATWLNHGLPLPIWAKGEYERPGRALWETCPFVPENGYGEIVVNLAWHWDAQLQTSS